MDAIDFRPEFFDLVRNLAVVNPQIVMRKKDGVVSIKGADPEVSVRYTLDTPAENFDFPAEEVGFYNFVEFCQFYGSFDEKPDLFMDYPFIVMRTSDSTVRYKTHDPEGMPANKLKDAPVFSNPDMKFQLNAGILSHLESMSSLSKAERATIEGDGDTIKITLQNKTKDRSVDKMLSGTKLVEAVEPFSFDIFADTFTKLPKKRDYECFIKRKGYIKFYFEEGDTKVGLYVAFLN